MLFNTSRGHRPFIMGGIQWKFYISTQVTIGDTNECRSSCARCKYEVPFSHNQYLLRRLCDMGRLRDIQKLYDSRWSRGSNGLHIETNHNRKSPSVERRKSPFVKRKMRSMRARSHLVVMCPTMEEHCASEVIKISFRTLLTKLTHTENRFVLTMKLRVRIEPTRSS